MRVVLTGGPCSGKTTLIDILSRRGYNVIEEVAREILNNKKDEDIDFEKLQLEILEKQLEKESCADEGLIFLDRGIGDVIAYCNFLLGKLPDKVKEIDVKGRYQQVFILDRFPLEIDGTRIEKSDDKAYKVHKEIERVYRENGYDVIKVPILKTREERADFVIKNIKYMKGGGE